MKASAFMSTLSTAGRLPDEFVAITAAEPPRLFVDRWVNGGRWVKSGWVSVELVWDGNKYAEVA